MIILGVCRIQIFRDFRFLENNEYRMRGLVRSQSRSRAVLLRFGIYANLIIIIIRESSRDNLIRN